MSNIDQRRHPALALTVICGAQLMVVLDATIVFVAIPTIKTHLHFSQANLVWVSTAYALTFGGLLLFGGRTGDLFGRRRMFMTGIAIFAAASLLGGFAQNDIWLILTRAAQGVGGAIASPTALSLIATNFEEGAERTKAMGVYAAMAGAGSAVGLLAGGLLTELISWRWVLFVNVPIGLAILVMAPRVLAESETHRGQLDVPGAITATSGLALLVYGLTSASPPHSWSSTTPIVCLVGAAVLLSVFILLETRSKRPLMPLRIFNNRNRSASYAMMLCFGAAMFASFYFMTQYFQDVLGYHAIKAGLAFLPMAVMIGIVAQVSAKLVQKIGIRVPLLIGPVSAAGGMFWLSRLSPSSGYLGAIFPLFLMAIGMGLAFVPLTLTAVSNVRPQESGLASALLNTGQQVGGSIGLALLSTVAVNAATSQGKHLATTHIQTVIIHHGLPAQLQHSAMMFGYDRAFIVATAIDILAFVISLLAIRATSKPSGALGPAAVVAEPAQP